jgi:hypothetical protein
MHDCYQFRGSFTGTWPIWLRGCVIWFSNIAHQAQRFYSAFNMALQAQRFYTAFNMALQAQRFSQANLKLTYSLKVLRYQNATINMNAMAQRLRGGTSWLRILIFISY